MSPAPAARASKGNDHLVWALLFLVLLGLLIGVMRFVDLPGYSGPELDSGPSLTVSAAADSGESYGRQLILSEDEDLKWLPPSDDPERLAAYATAHPGQADDVTNGMIKSLIFAQEGTTVGEPLALLGVGDPLDPTGFPLPVALQIITSLPPQLIECDMGSRMTMIPGDLVYRKDASLKDVCRLAPDVLSKACGRPIGIDVVEEMEKVWVARGEFRLQPLSESDGWIEIFSQNLVGSDGGTFSSGDIDALLNGVGDYIEPRRAIVSEIADPPPQYLAWHFNDELISPVGTDDRRDTKVFRNLSSQTNLSFSLERRPVAKIRVTAQQ